MCVHMEHFSFMCICTGQPKEKDIVHPICMYDTLQRKLCDLVARLRKWFVRTGSFTNCSRNGRAMATRLARPLMT